jgi:hypothetical protein
MRPTHTTRNYIGEQTVMAPGHLPHEDDEWPPSDPRAMPPTGDYEAEADLTPIPERGAKR